MTAVLAEVRAHLRSHFARAGVGAEPEAATVTFLGTEGIDVLRFGPDPEGVVHYVSLGCSRYGMGDDPVHGPRAEVIVSLRGSPVGVGLARSVAVLAAAPAVEGLVLGVDALVDFGQPVWGAPGPLLHPPGRYAPAPGALLHPPGRYAPAPGAFTAFLLGDSDIEPLTTETAAVAFLRAIPITATEAAWVRLKGPGEMRRAWQQDGVDVRDPNRGAARPR